MPTRIRRVLALVLCACLGTVPLQAESVQVTATTINVRGGPSTGSAVVATAARGEALEVLERTGDWYRVRTRAGVEGYVSAQFVRPVAAAPPATPAPATPPAAVTTAAARAGRVAITHKDVGCVLAGQFPRLDACFTPAEAVGRAQVQFRADETGPWYAVDMKGDGACASAVLPKPTRSISSFRYFIEVVDRSFTTVDKPDAAPGESFTPRVVSRDIECDQKTMMATSQPTASVFVSLARDAGGKVIQAAAQAAGTPASVAGFSMDGVTMGTTTGGAASAEGAQGSKAAHAASHGMKAVAIGGGIAAAGVVVAVAAGGGGGSSGSGGSGGTSPGSSTPSTGTSPGASTSLTGHWVGNAGNGEGITEVITGEGVTCTVTSDLTTDMVHSGSTFSGTGTSVTRGFNCSISLPVDFTSVLGQSGSGSFAGSASNGAITFQVGQFPFSGTYTATRIDATSTTVLEGFTFKLTWRQTKQ
jgi:hypothetical protein